MYLNYCSKYIIRCLCGKGEPAGKVKASKAIGREANKTVLQRRVVCFSRDGDSPTHTQRRASLSCLL